ncbi:iron ABC transporter permease [Providencia rettgeri]|uniref:ABC transporter permease n=1 Tax=Providencia TaxID=586 RepID=UPI0008FADE4F|nr:MULTISPECIES: iron ABC transporter permease [Providencia]APC13626.1 Putative 2-aminoethylphosphonate transport system permease protein PhnV [Providencia rettgeri]AVL72986.1 iron ABC transporter permease [Providencia rettgeri]EKH6495294.1 iron ABC transporter permease [Providencia rettgeri]ELR5051148.1 iron ABC transporter permease [Providencia rettgeri]ELR5154553.1 iron ABC transporter permease [Providencia rettgeri]
MIKIRFLPLLVLIALIILVVIPLSFIILQAVFPQLGQGIFEQPFEPIIHLLNEPELPLLLQNTLLLGGGVAVISAMIAIPLGALRGLFNIPFAKGWDLLFLIPFLIPPYIAGLSWMLTLQPNGYSQQLFGLSPGSAIFSLGGMMGIMALNLFPVLYFAVSRSMAANGNRLADVAQVHGATPWQAFFKVTLPLSLPSITAGLLLIFTLAIEEYGIPAAIGAPNGIRVLTTDIEQRLADWPIDLPGAASLSLVLASMAILAYTLQRSIVSGKNVVTTTGKAAAQVTRSLGGWRWPVVGIFTFTAFLAVGMPLLAMFGTAFSATVSGGLAWDNLTLRHFSGLIDSQTEALSALLTSVSLATVTAILTGILGFLSAWIVVSQRIRGAAVIDALSLLPISIPGIVIAVGMILAWNQPFWPITPYHTWGILLLAYSCLLLPYPVRYCSAALTQIGGSLTDAARVHGASAITTLRLVLFPLVLPSLVAAMMLVFAVASRELVSSLLLAPAGMQTVSIFVWRQFEQGSIGSGMAMACLAVLISLSLMLCAQWVEQRYSRKS